MLGADRRGEIVREAASGERAGCNDDRRFRWNSVDYFINYFDEWMTCDPVSRVRTEPVTVDRKGAPSRYPMKLSDLHHERAGSAHFFLQLADSVVEGGTAKRVGADELGHVVRLLSGRTRRGLLLDETN